MNETNIHRPFNKRAFTSVGMFISGLFLPFSGLMIHILQFEKLTLPGHFWMSVHDISGILFVIFSCLHIAYNWKALVSYSKKAKDIVMSKEALAALILIISVVGMVSSHAFHLSR